MTPAAFRSHFPIFASTAHLCSCSEGALSDRVMVAMSEFMTSWRIHAAPWQYWMEEVDRARTLFAELIHARPDQIAAVSCASEGAFQVAWSLDYQSRPRILTNDLEFPSVGHVWLAEQPRGAKVDFIPHLDGIVDAAAYEERLGPDVGLVSVPLVSYANGLRLPVADIAREAHRHGARVFVDAYQGVGVLPVDVRELDCDYLVAGTLKYLLGSPGLAFLYVRGGDAAAHDPILTGWFARRNPFAFDPRLLDYADDARRYQTGTPAIPAAFAGRAGLEMIRETEPEAVFAHVAGLADRLQGRLLEEGFRLFSPTDPTRRGPQVTVYVDDPESCSAHLGHRGVVVSPRGEVVRISLHYYNNDEDLDRVVAGLKSYRDR
jgi:selenocysteine lyase/cysteine desulfurase